MGRRAKPATFEEVLQNIAPCLEADATAPLLSVTGRLPSFTDFFATAQAAGVPYRKACGLASRKNLDAAEASEVRSRLFRLRHILDSRIEATLLMLLGSGAVSRSKLLKRQVFGFCKKQGVSFRLSLSTCVPSPLCGGGCYAHDGRERVTSTILSGCYNTLLCKLFESGDLLEEDLRPAVAKAVSLAQLDRQLAMQEFGFERRARIRLAHVGEIAAFPRFANWLGRTVADLSDSSVDCIVYTRHPKVSQLDTSTLVVNLTVDETSEKRRSWAKEGVRVVWSAWGGRLDSTAAVNFLEHHDNSQHSEPNGEGNVCPVTLASSERRVCDEFSCVRCFDHPEREARTPAEDRVFEISLPPRRTRHRSMLAEVQRGSAPVSKGRKVTSRRRPTTR
jgi:hypothetical protein